jgi:hypothetical protein
MTIQTFDVGLDLDGCSYDFYNAFVTYATEHRDLIVPVDNTTDEPATPPAVWAFYQDWGWTFGQFMDIFRHGIADGYLFRTGTPLAGAIEGWQLLAASGHRLHVITDRGLPGIEEIAHESTRLWLKEYELPYDTLTFSPDKTRILEFADDITRTAFIEDRVDNRDAIAAAGVPYAYLLRQPYNEHATHAPTVGSMLEFAEAVNRHAAQ